MTGILPGNWMPRYQQRWETGSKIVGLMVAVALLAGIVWAALWMWPYTTVRVCDVWAIEEMTFLGTSDGRALLLAHEVSVDDEVLTSEVLDQVIETGDTYLVTLGGSPLSREVVALKPSSSPELAPC